MSDQGAHNLNETSRGSLFRMCTEVSELCPVERTVLSYYPNFGANLFFAITFGLLVLLSGGLGVWKRTWTFTVAVTGGTILETVGELRPEARHESRLLTQCRQVMSAA